MWRIQEIAIVSAVLFLGCGSGEQCSTDDRRGLYLVTYMQLSGDCGPLPVALVDASAGGWVAVALGCSLLGEQWSEDQCTYDSSYVCADASGRRTSVRGTTTQEDDGSHVSGTESITITDDAGHAVCSSIYKIAAVRQ